MSDTQNTKKQHGKPFTKGDARINRGGRPKGYNAFRKAFRGEKDNEAIRERLKAIFDNPEAKDSDVIMATRLWWEYGWGKAPSAPEDNAAIRDSGRPLAGATKEEILAALRGEKP